MSVGVEALFTSALGLKSPWEVVKVELDTAKRRIDFDLACNARQLPCPACGVNGQGVHDRVRYTRAVSIFSSMGRGCMPTCHGSIAALAARPRR